MPAGVSFDGAGNVYLVGNMTLGSYDNQLTFGDFGMSPLNIYQDDLRAFDPNGTPLWNLQGLEFIDTAAPDAATAGQDAYTNYHHIKLDLNQNNGKEWSWYGVTVDPIRYPLDPRLAESANNNTLTVVEVRNIGGHKYLAFTDQYSHIFMLHRLDGEIAVPMAVFTQWTVRAWATTTQPQNAASLWVDHDGNGNPEAGAIQERR